ncbi:MAG: hypothetical protein ACE5I1_15440 [bacterium]
MFRLLIWAAIIYFGYRLVQSLFLPRKQPSEPSVQGKNKSEPLNLNNLDVEDASYREIDDKEKPGRN